MVPAWEVTMGRRSWRMFFLSVWKFSACPMEAFFSNTQMSAKEIWKQERYQEHVLNPSFTVLPWWNPLDANSLTTLSQSICAPCSSVPTPTGHCLSWAPARLVPQKAKKTLLIYRAVITYLFWVYIMYLLTLLSRAQKKKSSTRNRIKFTWKLLQALAGFTWSFISKNTSFT